MSVQIATVLDIRNRVMWQDDVPRQNSLSFRMSICGLLMSRFVRRAWASSLPSSLTASLKLLSKSSSSSWYFLLTCKALFSFQDVFLPRLMWLKSWQRTTSSYWCRRFALDEPIIGSKNFHVMIQGISYCYLLLRYLQEDLFVNSLHQTNLLQTMV